MKFPGVMNIVERADRYLKNCTPNICKNCDTEPSTGVYILSPSHSFEEIIRCYIFCEKCYSRLYWDTNVDKIENFSNILLSINEGTKEWNDKYGVGYVILKNWDKEND